MIICMIGCNMIFVIYIYISSLSAPLPPDHFSYGFPHLRKLILTISSFFIDRRLFSSPESDNTSFILMWTILSRIQLLISKSPIIFLCMNILTGLSRILLFVSRTDEFTMCSVAPESRNHFSFCLKWLSVDAKKQ